MKQHLVVIVLFVLVLLWHVTAASALSEVAAPPQSTTAPQSEMPPTSAPTFEVPPPTSAPQSPPPTSTPQFEVPPPKSEVPPPTSAPQPPPTSAPQTPPPTSVPQTPPPPPPKPEVPPPTTSAPLPPPSNETRVCCNKCHPVIVMVPKYKYKIHIVDVPVPVFISPKDVVDKCPEGFQHVDRDMCVRKIVLRGSSVSCPPGWLRVDDETCLKVYRLKSSNDTPKQEEDAERKHRKCHEDEVVPKIKCPRGWRQISPYHCRKVVDCPKGAGYRLSKRLGCVKVPVRCPPPLKRVGRNKCIIPELKCPPGYRFDKKRNACIKIVTTVKCPAGYRLLKRTNKCVLIRCYRVKCAKKPARGCPEGKIWKIVRGACCAKCVSCGCPMDWRQVCSTDGTTFANECTARCLGATIKKHAPCVIVDEPPRDKCPPNWEPNEDCEKKCLDQPFAPVCTGSGLTLPSQCVADCFSETVVRKGKCKPICK